MSGNFFTRQELDDFERLLSGPQTRGPDVILMNSRDFAALKVAFAFSDHIYAMEERMGRRVGRMEYRWMEAKFYKRKCQPRLVDPIPFPKEEP